MTGADMKKAHEILTGAMRQVLDQHLTDGDPVPLIVVLQSVIATIVAETADPADLTMPGTADALVRTYTGQLEQYIREEIARRLNPPSEPKRH